MRTRFLPVLALLAALAVAACTDDPAGTVGPHTVEITASHGPDFCAARPHHPHCSPHDSALLNNGGGKGGPSGGGGGKNQEPTAAWSLPSSGSFAVLDDGQGDYVDGNCSTTTRIFVDGSGDATLQLDRPRGKACGRTYSVHYPDGHPSQEFHGRMNLRNMSVIPVDATEERTFVVRHDSASRCGRLIFGSVPVAPVSDDSDPLSVSRLDARTWVAQSTGTRAYCESEDAILDGMAPVYLVIVADQDLP